MIRHGGGGHIDSQVVVQRGEYFLEPDRSFGDLGSQSIGGADDLAGAHAPANNAALTLGQ